MQLIAGKVFQLLVLRDSPGVVMPFSMLQRVRQVRRRNTLWQITFTEGWEGNRNGKELTRDLSRWGETERGDGSAVYSWGLSKFRWKARFSTRTRRIRPSCSTMRRLSDDVGIRQVSSFSSPMKIEYLSPSVGAHPSKSHFHSPRWKLCRLSFSLFSFSFFFFLLLPRRVCLVSSRLVRSTLGLFLFRSSSRANAKLRERKSVRS